MEEILELLADETQMGQKAISREKQSLDILLKLMDMKDTLELRFFSWHLDHWLLLFYHQIARKEAYATYSRQLESLLEQEYSDEYVRQARNFLENMSIECFAGESPEISIKQLDHA